MPADKQFKADDPPAITLQVDTEGKDWNKEAPEFIIDKTKGDDINIPLQAANVYINKKRSARYQ
jgi:hypothetical protein